MTDSTPSLEIVPPISEFTNIDCFAEDVRKYLVKIFLQKTPALRSELQYFYDNVSTPYRAAIIASAIYNHYASKIATIIDPIINPVNLYLGDYVIANAADTNTIHIIAINKAVSPRAATAWKAAFSNKTETFVIVNISITPSTVSFTTQTFL